MLMTEQKHTYEFGYSRNSYFSGSDGHITRDDGRSISVRTDDGLMSVNVKDHHGHLEEHLDDEHRHKLRDLIAAKPDETTEWGGDYSDVLYERMREQWWHDARWTTGAEGPGMSDPEAPDWAGDVYSAGRSGGWCVIEGTSDLAASFPTRTLEEAVQEARERATCSECGARTYRSEECFCDEGDGEDYDEVRDELVAPIEKRDEFLMLAFALVANIDELKKGWLADVIDEEYGDLEDKRDAAIVRGEN